MKRRHNIIFGPGWCRMASFGCHVPAEIVGKIVGGLALKWIVWAALLVAVAAMPVRAETLLERGTYLMRSIVACGNCHTMQTPTGPAPGRELAGGVPLKFDVFDAYPSNRAYPVVTHTHYI